MHRHSYSGKKLSRTSEKRRALMRGLLDALILYERIETTQARAKEIVPLFDRLVTKAKKQDIHNYRQILAETINPIAAQKLNTELVKGFSGRSSGYTRLTKIQPRLGDSAPMVVVELALDEEYLKKNQSKPPKAEVKQIKSASKPKVKTTLKTSRKKGAKV